MVTDFKQPFTDPTVSEVGIEKMDWKVHPLINVETNEINSISEHISVAIVIFIVILIGIDF